MLLKKKLKFTGALKIARWTLNTNQSINHTGALVKKCQTKCTPCNKTIDIHTISCVQCLLEEHSSGTLIVTRLDPPERGGK